MAFCVQHIILLLKIILAEVIEDEPEWVQDDIDVVDNRVDQMAGKIEDMKFMERLSDHYQPIELLEDVFAILHRDKELAAQLVPKLKQGCKEFIAMKKKELEEEEDDRVTGNTIAKEKLSNIIATFSNIIATFTNIISTTTIINTGKNRTDKKILLN